MKRKDRLAESAQNREQVFQSVVAGLSTIQEISGQLGLAYAHTRGMLMYLVGVGRLVSNKEKGTRHFALAEDDPTSPQGSAVQRDYLTAALFGPAKTPSIALSDSQCVAVLTPSAPQ
jgi:hypothetical protein